MSNYHLDELKIALDPKDRKHALPPAVGPSACVLDIGCGAGQTLIATYPDHVTYDIDIDRDALRVGREHTQNIRFTNGSAEALPFRDHQFDLVTARVSLPYTNIPVSVREMRRVLKKGGRLWLSLHPFSLTWKQARESNYKGRIYFLYFLANSALLHLFQKQFALFGRQESFQTTRGIAALYSKSAVAIFGQSKEFCGLTAESSE